MRLPNAEHAAIDIEKLKDYCLNPEHPKGKHKARVFYEKLGLTRNDAELLRELVLESNTHIRCRGTRINCIRTKVHC